MLSALCRFCSTEWEDYYEWWICENMKESGNGLNLDVSVPQLNVYKRYMSHVYHSWMSTKDTWAMNWKMIHMLSFSLLISNVNIRNMDE